MAMASSASATATTKRAAKATPAGSPAMNFPRIVEGLVHAIRNPLFAARLDLHALSNVARELGEGGRRVREVEAIVGQCEKQLEQVERFLAELVRFAHPTPPEPEIVDLRRLLAVSLKAVKEAHPQLSIRLASGNDEPLVASIDRGRFSEALSAVMEWFSQTTQRVLAVSLKKHGGDAKLCIRAPGWRVTEHEHCRMFEPFAVITGVKPGLSLAIACRCMTEAGGSCDCEVDEDGVCISFRLPTEGNSDPHQSPANGALDSNKR